MASVTPITAPSAAETATAFSGLSLTYFRSFFSAERIFFLVEARFALSFFRAAVIFFVAFLGMMVFVDFLEGAFIFFFVREVLFDRVGFFLAGMCITYFCVIVSWYFS